MVAVVEAAACLATERKEMNDVFNHVMLLVQMGVMAVHSYTQGFRLATVEVRPTRKAIFQAPLAANDDSFYQGPTIVR